MIIDTTSFSVELLERNGWIEAILPSARNAVRQRLLMCCFIDSVWPRCTPRYVTVVWKGMQLPPIFADSQPTEPIHTDEPTSIISVFFCVKLQFVALHPWQSIAYTGLNVGLSKSEITRGCTVRDVCVISVLVTVTAVTCYDITEEEKKGGGGGGVTVYSCCYHIIYLTYMERLLSVWKF